MDCPYCSATPEDAWIFNEHAIAIPPDEHAGSCHAVVAPRRHVPVFYDLDVEEQRAIWDVLRELQQRIRQSLVVQGFDAGFVDSADGTGHTHVHLIPRVPGHPVERPLAAEWVALE
ncbi:MAG TPA: HIT domain-containing protein [Candidatus Acidoferrales bacterium]|nr:HIT domain-containing protein [Candidatus Acidoferrales bacterium]